MTLGAQRIRDRRLALGLKLSDLAWVTQPDAPALARLDAALAVLEAGGSLEDARCGASGEAVLRPEPGKRGPRAKVSRETRQPTWPAHNGWAAKQEHLPAHCFIDAITRDAGICRSDRPATAVLTQSGLGC